MKLLIFILLAMIGLMTLGFYKYPVQESHAYCKVIVIGNMSWTFNDMRECGRYKTGDWWVRNSK